MMGVGGGMGVTGEVEEILCNGNMVLVDYENPDKYLNVLGMHQKSGKIWMLP